MGRDHKKRHSRFGDTILTRTVQIETILEVNNMLLEIQEASDDITNVYEEDESDENVDDNGHSSSSEEESDVELII